MNSPILKVRSEYAKLSKGNRSIADYLLRNPEEFMNATAQEIGDRSETSSASVVRFARRMGYEGLEALKRSMIVDVHEQSDIPMIDPIVSENDTLKETGAKLHQLIDNASKDFFFQLDYNELEKSIEIIQSAENVYIIGTGASSLPAYDLYHKLNRINVRALFNFDSHMTLEFVHYAKENDVVIVFSYSGSSMEAVYPAQIARDNGASVIAITRSMPSKLVNLATHVISVPSDESVVRVGAITSKFNAMIAADLLYFGIIQPNIKTIESDLISTSNITKKLKVGQ